MHNDNLAQQRADYLQNKVLVDFGFFADSRSRNAAFLSKEKHRTTLDAAAKFHVGAFSGNAILEGIRRTFEQYGITVTSDPNNGKGQRRRTNSHNELVSVASVNTAVTTAEGFTPNRFTPTPASRKPGFEPTGLRALELYARLVTERWGRKSESLTGFMAKGSIDFLSMALRLENFNVQHHFAQTPISPAEFANRAMERCFGAHKEARISAFHLWRYNLGLSPNDRRRIRITSLTKMLPKGTAPDDKEDLDHNW